MKVWNIGSRWDKNGKKENSILHIFVKYNIVFAGEEYYKKIDDSVRTGDLIVISDGITMVYAGEILSEPKPLNKFNFEDFKETLKINGVANNKKTIGFEVKLYKLKKEEQIKYRSNAFERVIKHEKEIINIIKSREYFLKATEAHQKSNFETARNEYEKTIKVNPFFFEAYNNLALILISYFKEYKKAKQYYEKAIELKPNYADYYYNLAILLKNYFHENENARQYFEKAIELNPNHVKAYVSLAKLYSSNFKEYEKAKKYSEKAIEIDPEDSLAYSNYANLLEKHFKNYKGAKQYYEKAIKLNPNFAKAYDNLGSLLSNYFNEPQEARQYFEKAIELNPQNAMSYYNLATTLWLNFKEYEKAKKYFEKAIKLDPNFAGAYNNFANLLSQKFKDYKKARLYFEKAIELSPSNFQAYNNLAILLNIHFFEYKEAKKNYGKAIELKEDAIIYNNLAILLWQKLQEYEKAKEYFEKVIELKPTFAEVYNNFALLLEKHFKNYKKAKQYFEKAIELNSNFAGAYSNLAVLLENHFKDYEKAKQYFEKAISINPNSAEVYHNLASLYYNKLKNIEKAQNYFIKALIIDPELEITREALSKISNFNNETFISNIYIKNIHNLKKIKDLNIKLSKTQKHLFITGKNGSGKTSILEEINNNLQDILAIPITNIFTEEGLIKFWKDKGEYNLKIDVVQNLLDLRLKYETNNFLTVFFNDKHTLVVEIPEYIEKIELKQKYLPNENISNKMVKYIVFQDYKQLKIRNNEKHEIQKTVERISDVLKIVFEEEDLKFVSGMENDNLDFYIKRSNGAKFNFNQLPAGYAAVLKIIFELILQTQAKPNKSGTEGIVLIDEPELHLHIELQKRIMPMLIKMFPNVQFIIATHSPFILNSVSNAVIYDLETNIREEDFSAYAYDGIVETYFDSDKYSNKIKYKLKEYENLINKNNLTEYQEYELEDIEEYLKEIPFHVAKELVTEFQRLKLHKILKTQ